MIRNHPFAQHAKPRHTLRKLAGYAIFAAITALVAVTVAGFTAQPTPQPEVSMLVPAITAMQHPVQVTADITRPLVVRVPDNGVQATCRPAQIHKRAILVVIRDSVPVDQFTAVCTADGPLLYVWDATS